MLKYKVGDTVQVVKHNNSEWEFGDLATKQIVGVVKALFGKTRYLVKVEGYEGVYEDGCFLFGDEHLTLISSETKNPNEVTQTEQKTPIKSDGGSSNYYFSKLPEDVIDKLVETGGIEIKDIVKHCFYNDADCKDIIKAIKRVMENLRGGGKEGIDAKYDMNKIKFFVEELQGTVDRHYKEK